MADRCLQEAGNGWDFIYVDECAVPDWQVKTGDLAADNQLRSAVIIQLFSNRRAPDDLDLPDGLPDPQGWWGDFYHPFEIGSLLWTLYREALTDNTVLRAEKYVRDALAPIIKQGAAAGLEVEVTRERDGLNIDIQLLAHDGSVSFDEQFQRFWKP